MQFGHLKRGTRGDLCPEGGYRAHPGLSPLAPLGQALRAWLVLSLRNKNHPPIEAPRIILS
jgi:hypothetical protein